MSTDAPPVEARDRRILVIGLGSIGMRHARNFRDLGAEIVAGVDPSKDRRARFREELNGAAHPSVEDALDCGAALAIIASPSSYHVDQARACAAVGMNLFIEKPLGSSLEGVHELVDQVARRGLYAHVGSNWKFHPAMRMLKSLLEDGVTGPTAVAQVHAGQWLPDWHPWEDYRHGYSARSDLGGGVVLDSHEIDCLTWLLGPVDEIHGLTARSGALELETEDVACACLRFECGALATIQIDYIQRDYRRRYHLSGPRGTVEWDFGSGLVTVYRADEDGSGVRREEMPAKLDDLNEMYIEQARHVMAGIRGEVAPVTPVSHAEEVLALALELKESHD